MLKHVCEHLLVQRLYYLQISVNVILTSVTKTPFAAYLKAVRSVNVIGAILAMGRQATAKVKHGQYFIQNACFIFCHTILSWIKMNNGQKII